MNPTSNPTAVKAEPAAPQEPAARSPFVPLLLIVLALLAWSGTQVWELYNQRGTLRTVFAGQQQTVDNAGKLRGSLDALAADTQRMANAGNPNASLLVDELRKRGVTITVPAAGAASAPR